MASKGTREEHHMTRHHLPPAVGRPSDGAHAGPGDARTGTGFPRFDLARDHAKFRLAHGDGGSPNAPLEGVLRRMRRRGHW